MNEIEPQRNGPKTPEKARRSRKRPEVFWKFWESMDYTKTTRRMRKAKDGPEAIRQHYLSRVENGGFKKRVLYVAASGFLTDAYSLFSTNVIFPAIAYVYQDEDFLHWSYYLNITTLVGSGIGMVLFGRLADVYGRKKLYGVELWIVIVSALGLTLASPGSNNSMLMQAWLIFFRLALGIGIGAEYPLSALIASEWSSRKWRSTMLACVFLMQPLGQFFAYWVAAAVLNGQGKRFDLSANGTNPDNNTTKAAVDSVWRCVVGVGAIPAAIAIALRLTIPETPRFDMEVLEDEPLARKSIMKVYGPEPNILTNPNSNTQPSDKILLTGLLDTSIQSPTSFSADGIQEMHTSEQIEGRHEEPTDTTDKIELDPRNRVQDQHKESRNNTGDIADPDSFDQITDHQKETANIRIALAEMPPLEPNHIAPNGLKKTDAPAWVQRPKWLSAEMNDFLDFLGKHHRWRMLLGVSANWCILDICFYGLGLDIPRIIAKLWISSPCTPSDNLASWRNDPCLPTETIYDTLMKICLRNMELISTSAIAGSLILLVIVNHIPRVRFLSWSFVALAVLFLVCGSLLVADGIWEAPAHVAILVFYSLSLFGFNLGPNTLTFMLPAELFPTKWRGTCYGVAAGCGKAGAVVILIVMRFAGGSGRAVSDPQVGKTPFAVLMFVFTPLMLAGAFIAWVCIPEVQGPPEWREDGEEAEKETWIERRYRENRSLERIAEDPLGKNEKSFPRQELTASKKLSGLFGFISRARRPPGVEGKVENRRSQDIEMTAAGS